MGVGSADAAERVLGPLVPELRLLLLDLGLRARMKRRSTRVTDNGLRRGAQNFRKQMADAKLPRFVRATPITIADVAAEWVRALEAEAPADPETRKLVLYFHGGGFFMSSPESHRPLTWRLARACARPVLAVEYRKAPDHAFPAWLDDAYAVYAALLASGHAASDIILSGDSAGGNIALALVNRLRREGAPMPDGLVLLSPWLDLACGGSTFTTNRRRDAMFEAGAVRVLGTYLTRHCDVKDPEVSPLHSDFRGFPRMLLLAGSTEVFLDDIRTLATRARSAGVPVELYVYRHMPHVFPMFASLLPRANASFAHIRAFVGPP